MFPSGKLKQEGLCVQAIAILRQLDGRFDSQYLLGKDIVALVILGDEPGRLPHPAHLEHSGFTEGRLSIQEHGILHIVALALDGAAGDLQLEGAGIFCGKGIGHAAGLIDLDSPILQHSIVAEHRGGCIQHEKPGRGGGLLQDIFIIIRALSACRLHRVCQHQRRQAANRHPYEHLQVPAEHLFKPPAAIVSFMKLFHIVKTAMLSAGSRVSDLSAGQRILLCGLNEV